MKKSVKHVCGTEEIEFHESFPLCDCAFETASEENEDAYDEAYEDEDASESEYNDEIEDCGADNAYTCPYCGFEIELDQAYRSLGNFLCPYCGTRCD